METEEFISRSHLDAATLNVWIDEQWLIPLASGSAPQFSDADLARARLIRQMHASGLLSADEVRRASSVLDVEANSDTDASGAPR